MFALSPADGWARRAAADVCRVPGRTSGSVKGGLVQSGCEGNPVCIEYSAFSCWFDDWFRMYPLNRVCDDTYRPKRERPMIP